MYEGKNKNKYRVLDGKPEGTEHLEDLRMDRRIILKRIFIGVHSSVILHKVDWRLVTDP